ncbi:MAG: lipopolysaccharide assembly protein LapA domain-containing protein [bacterium]
MRPRIAIALVLTVLLLVLAAQNTAVVEIRLLFWTVSMSRVLLILFAAAAGFAAGTAYMGWRDRGG